MQRGISGGITLLGVFGGMLGAFIISFFAIPGFGIKGALVITIAGVVSSAVDSILGAAFQAKYLIQNNAEGKHLQQLTEQKCLNDKQLKLVHGFRWINNDVVNFVSVLVCGLLVTLIW